MPAGFQLREYQLSRLEHIQAWHAEVVNSRPVMEADSSIKFLTLWACFNALYNIADMPHRKPNVHKDGTVSFRGNGDRTNVKEIAKRISQDELFILNLFAAHRTYFQQLADRVPPVQQPDDVDVIEYEVKRTKHQFHPKAARGIASYDNRIILDDGHKIFEYTSLEIKLNANGELRNPNTFMQQYLLVVYQIRNNVAHGGAAAFFKRGDKVAEETIFVLNAIVRHLLAHPDLIVVSGV